MTNFEQFLKTLDFDTTALMIHGDASLYFNKCKRCAYNNEKKCNGNCHEGIIKWLQSEAEATR